MWGYEGRIGKGICSGRGRSSTVTFISEHSFEWLGDLRQTQVQPLVAMEMSDGGWEAEA